MDALEAQKMVADAVSARGYRDGWNADQFAARQLAKLIEETAEASEWVHGVEIFDNSGAWDWIEVDALARFFLCEEVADIQVVLFALADALGMDVVAAAVEKSAADVERGVRK